MDTPLHDSTIQKIFREHFKGEVPIVKSGSEKTVLISNVKPALSTNNGVEIKNPSSYYKYKNKNPDEICCFNIISSSKYYSDQEFGLRFNDQNEFIIEDRHWLNSPVYDLEQIYTLFDKMKLEYNRLETNYLKREAVRVKKQKVKGLKHQAIIAKINQIAKEDKFKFCVMKYVYKVKLVIYLAQAEEMAIDIPYEKFQETLKNLRATIQTIRELRESGVTFQIRSYPANYYREPHWISYD
ncbi:MAG: hypothetical protein DRR19_19950 [Candidatus Parabeggiatoa sp. nov. 1]|nr:MAG: hypothetical protein DRR19_19950 [Gammaproteobacteria bacterium]